MIKLIPPHAWGPGDGLQVALVKAGMSGFGGHDFGAFVKRAGHPLAQWVRENRPLPGDTLIHAIALGSTETIGPNRNSDGYPRNMLARDWPTFEKYARFYRDHKNSGPDVSYGTVKKAYYNAELQRIEVICALNGTKAAAARNGGHVADWEHELLESGRDIAVSQSVRVPYDECMVAGTMIETAHGVVPIEHITVDTEVRTHLGRLRRVTRLFRSTSRSARVRLRVGGLMHETELTGNHPVYVVRAAAVVNCAARVGVRRKHHRLDATAQCRDCRAVLAVQPEWVDAAAVTSGDYVVRQLDRPGTESVGAAHAYVLGAYAGNGSIVWQARGGKHAPRKDAVGVEISQGTAHPDVIAKLLAAAQAIHGRVQPVRRVTGAEAVTVTVSDRGLAANCRRLVGERSKEKTVGAGLYALNAADRIAFLAGLFDTDGSPDPAHGNGQITTSSEQLAAGVQRLFWGLRIPVTVGRYRVKSGFSVDSFTHVVSIPARGIRALAPYSAKAGRVAARVAGGSEKTLLTVFTADHVLLAVRKVTSVGGVTPVFNFAVAEDESYVANGFVVHNCSACGNKARTRAHYCKAASCPRGGCAEHLGRVFDDGFHLYVENPSGTFFDLSNVTRTRGADRTAFVTGKVAAADRVVGGAELAEMMGLVAPEYLLTPRAFAALRAGAIGKEAGDITMSLPDDAARHARLAELAAAGVVLPPPTWLALVTGVPAEKCARAFGRKAPDPRADLTARPDLHDVLEDGALADIRLSPAKWAHLAPTPRGVEREAARAALCAGEKTAAHQTAPEGVRAEAATRYLAYQANLLAAHENSVNFDLLFSECVRQSRNLSA